jgi:hypothetical protein
MSDVKQQEEAQQQQTMSSRALEDLNFILGDEPNSPNPYLEELNQSFGKTQEAAQEQTSLPPTDFLINNPANKNGEPDVKKEIKEEPAAEAPEQKQELEQEEFIVDSPLFKIKKEKEESVDFSSIEGIEKVNEFLSKELPDIKDVNTLLSSYKELSSKATEYETVKSQNEQLITGLSNLDPDLIKAIEIYEQGGDFRSYISSRPSLDYKKSATEISKIDLIKAYFPEDLSQDDIEGSDKDSDYYDEKTEKYVNRLHKEAINKFNEEKKEWSERGEKDLAKANEYTQHYEKSVKTSLNSVKEFFPDAPTTYIKSIEDKLMKNGIQSLFYDEKGFLKQDAAARFVRASDDGGNLITQLQKIAYDKAKTEANLDILTRSQRTAPNQGARSVKQGESDARVNAYIDAITAGL